MLVISVYRNTFTIRHLITFPLQLWLPELFSMSRCTNIACTCRILWLVDYEVKKYALCGENVGLSVGLQSDVSDWTFCRIFREIWDRISLTKELVKQALFSWKSANWKPYLSECRKRISSHSVHIELRRSGWNPILLISQKCHSAIVRSMKISMGKGPLFLWT